MYKRERIEIIVVMNITGYMDYFSYDAIVNFLEEWERLKREKCERKQKEKMKREIKENKKREKEKIEKENRKRLEKEERERKQKRGRKTKRKEREFGRIFCEIDGEEREIL